MVVIEPLFSSSLRDDHGLGDIAYISLAVVTALLLFAAVNMVGLVWADWITCKREVILPTVALPNIPVTVIACKPDVLVLGQAFALAAGAFSTALGALALYMAATRRAAGTSTTTTKIETTTAAAPAPPTAPLGTPSAPIPVDIVHMPSGG